MLRPRIIPCLLIQRGGLVKTQGFKDPKYVGDPINAVRIFNEKETDELMVLDIDATVNKAEPDFELIAKLAAECRMPLCYGGGITGAEQASRLVDMGVEKIAVSAAAVENPTLLSDMEKAIGRQSVVAILDLRKRGRLFSRSYEVCTHNAQVVHALDPIELAKHFQDAGAGEIVVNSIDRDGQMNGFDLELAADFRRSLNVPLTILGGCGSLRDISELFSHLGVVGAGVGSLFVFKGKYRAVLISYPTRDQKEIVCRSAEEMHNHILR